MLGVIERHDHDAGVAGDIREGSDDRDGPRAAQDVVGVIGELAAQEVVERVAVEQGTGRHEDQALIPVGDVEIAIHRRGRLCS